MKSIVLKILPIYQRNGAVSSLKSAAVLLHLACIGYIFYLWQSGAFFPRVLNGVIHETGFWAAIYLLATLAITPLRFVSGYNGLLIIRRQLGLMAFFLSLGHFTLYCFDQGIITKIITEIFTRYYLLLGFVALLLLTPLAITSTDAMIKRLGAERWNRLHKLTYLIGYLVMLHFLMQVKLDLMQALVCAGVFIMLRMMRYIVKKRRGIDAKTMLIIAPCAAALTLALDVFWHYVMKNIPLARILKAQVDFEAGFRPAYYILLIGLILAATMAAKAKFKQQP